MDLSDDGNTTVDDVNSNDDGWPASVLNAAKTKKNDDNDDDEGWPSSVLNASAKKCSNGDSSTSSSSRRSHFGRQLSQAMDLSEKGASAAAAANQDATGDDGADNDDDEGWPASVLNASKKNDDNDDDENDDDGGWPSSVLNASKKSSSRNGNRDSSSSRRSHFGRQLSQAMDLSEKGASAATAAASNQDATGDDDDDGWPASVLNASKKGNDDDDDDDDDDDNEGWPASVLNASKKSANCGTNRDSSTSSLSSSRRSHFGRQLSQAMDLSEKRTNAVAADNQDGTGDDADNDDNGWPASVLNASKKGNDDDDDEGWPASVLNASKKSANCGTNRDSSTSSSSRRSHFGRQLSQAMDLSEKDANTATTSYAATGDDDADNDEDDGWPASVLNASKKGNDDDDDEGWPTSVLNASKKNANGTNRDSSTSSSSRRSHFGRQLSQAMDLSDKGASAATTNHDATGDDDGDNDDDDGWPASVLNASKKNENDDDEGWPTSVLNASKKSSNSIRDSSTSTSSRRSYLGRQLSQAMDLSGKSTSTAATTSNNQNDTESN